MIAILGIIGALVLVVLFLMFRSAGRFGQQPSSDERMRHNGASVQQPKPRADGLD